MTEPSWWLSFADGNLPVGQQFLGVIIAQGYTIEAVVTETHLREINPGGEISFAEIPPEHVPAPEFHWRLLTYTELVSSGLLEG